MDLEDIIAVAVPDAVLVAHKDRAQDAKATANKVKKRARPKLNPCRVIIAVRAGTKASPSVRASRLSASS